MYVVTGEEMRQIDRYTMDEIGLKEETLMESAGQAFCRQLVPTMNRKSRILVLIGIGNNGGDGFVISRILKDAQFHADAVVIPPEEKIKGASKIHKQVYENAGYRWEPYSGCSSLILNNYDVIIDAMLGTGLAGTPRDPYREIIRAVNAAGKRVIAVDLPSGTPAQEGMESSITIMADETYSFQAAKMAAYIYPEAASFGRMHVVDIGLPEKAFSYVNVKREIIDAEKVASTLPVRRRNAHKGNSGKALIIGGAREMTGAAALSGEACLRSGAGLVTLAVPEEILPVVSQKVTEATFHPLKCETGEIKPFNFPDEFSRYDYAGAAIGPGLGRRHKHSILSLLKGFEGPVVIDADGLFHFSRELEEWKKVERKGPVVITPHPGEMARLTGIPASEGEKRRFELSRSFAQEFGVYVVLKGAHTIVSAPDGKQWVNTTGNPSLAKGGSGDVLTGIILAFLLQHENTADAICNAVYVHGKAADELVKTHDILSVTATDITAQLPKVLYSLRRQ
jgi:NAD(P)H-hydrate epimerase